MSDPIESPGPEGSTTGLDPKVASLLCYALGFVSGIVFLVVELENRTVRFHAYQSLATFLPLFIVSVVAGALPLIGWIISAALVPIALILWVVLMVKAIQGEHYVLPVVGEWAEQQAQLQS